VGVVLLHFLLNAPPYTSRSFDDTYVGLGTGTACHSASTGWVTAWYRLTGTYPKLQQQGAYVINIGGTVSPGFMQFSHPSTTGQTISGIVGFNYSGSVTNWTSSIQVTNCGSYFVYYLPPNPTTCTIAYVSGF